MITGDGDGLSIGGNHMIHSLRRNVNLKIILFNNEIYGLTKGQYSPTTPQGQKTKTTPFGSVDAPFNPVQLALGAGATFVARTLDVRPKHMKAVLKAAAEHKGAAFVEVWQNCVIFNDGAFKDWSDKKVRDDQTIDIEAGQPMIFGEDKDKGLKAEGCHIKVVPAAEASIWDPHRRFARPGVPHVPAGQGSGHAAAFRDLPAGARRRPWTDWSTSRSPRSPTSGASAVSRI